MLRDAFRKPDGTWTRDFEESYAAWHKIIDPFVAATGCVVIGYDPGILFSFEGISIDLPVSFVERINSLINIKADVVELYNRDNA